MESDIVRAQIAVTSLRIRFPILMQISVATHSTPGLAWRMERRNTAFTRTAHQRAIHILRCLRSVEVFQQLIWLNLKDITGPQYGGQCHRATGLDLLPVTRREAESQHIFLAVAGFSP